jgi:transcriptional regulator with XRE-family HTH domain
MDKLELLEKVGQKIKEVREYKKMTQVDLAVRIEEDFGKFDVTNISRIESGRTNPTIFTLHRISLALEVDLYELLKI